MRVMPVGSDVQRLQSSTQSVSGFISHANVSVLPGINAVIRDCRLAPFGHVRHLPPGVPAHDILFPVPFRVKNRSENLRDTDILIRLAVGCHVSVPEAQAAANDNSR